MFPNTKSAIDLHFINKLYIFAPEKKTFHSMNRNLDMNYWWRFRDFPGGYRAMHMLDA